MSAKVLDYKRLGKQRVESRQILDVLTNNKKSWSNHPAVNMWRGFETALAIYSNAMIFEWIYRGYKNNMEIIETDYNVEFPPWLGNEKFHLSHKSNLIRKDPVYYNKFWPNIPDNIPYFWPSKQ